MVYPEHFIAPMREELARHGVIETRTPEEVDRLLVPDSGTVLMVVNSVCGCAAGSARPGVIQSLEHDVRPGETSHGVCRGRRSRRGKSTRDPLRLSSFVALRCAVSRRQADLHAASPPDRGTRSQPNRGDLEGSLRPALRAGRARIAVQPRRNWPRTSTVGRRLFRP